MLCEFVLQYLKSNSNIQKVQDVFSDDSEKRLENNRIEISKTYKGALIINELSGKKQKPLNFSL